MNFRARADIYYTDGTSDLNVNVTPLTDQAQYSTWIWPCGYNVISPLADPNKDISHWDFWLIDAGGTVTRRTPKMRYRLVDHTFLDVQLLYESSTGAWETVMLTGRKEEGITVNKEDYKKLLPISYSQEDRQNDKRTITYQQEIEVSTGFKRREEFLPLQDLLISENIFLYRNNKRIRVNILADSYSIVRDDDYLFALNLKLVRAYDQKNFSNILGL